jgi:TPR repeat protein
VKWWTNAAAQGMAKAQFSLGLMYEQGRGVIQDHQKALDWVHKAADQGYADAQTFLAKSKSQ